MKSENAKTLAKIAACVADGGHVCIKRGERADPCSLSYAAACLDSEGCVDVFISVWPNEAVMPMVSNIRNDEIIAQTSIAINALSAALGLLPAIDGLKDKAVSQRVATIHALLCTALDVADLAIHQAYLRYLTHKDSDNVLYQ